MSEKETRVSLVREEDYRFRVRFQKDGMPDLFTDEPPPIGKDSGPSPAQLLATAVGNCMAASLLYCLNKSRLPVEGLEAEVRVAFTRNEAGRLKIGGLHVQLLPQWTAETAEKAQRCLEVFEDYCVVSQAVKHGVPVNVQVTGTLVPEGAR